MRLINNRESFRQVAVAFCSNDRELRHNPGDRLWLLIFPFRNDPESRAEIVEKTSIIGVRALRGGHRLSYLCRRRRGLSSCQSRGSWRLRGTSSPGKAARTRRACEFRLRAGRAASFGVPNLEV